MNALLVWLLVWMLPFADPVPADEDVVAGPWGALMFVALILAVVFLAFSFNKQLRKTKANKEAGVFDDKAPGTDPDSGADRPSDA